MVFQAFGGEVCGGEADRHKALSLLNFVMILVIKDHSLAQDFHWIEICQPDWLVAGWA